jgi:hypothetical protein
MHRPFMYEQGGPYSHNLTGIVFNERELRDVKSQVGTDRADFRFGFVIWRLLNDDGDWVVYGGFEMWNKTLARVRFMQNIRENAPEVGKRILAWLRRHRRDGFAMFDQEENKRFYLRGSKPNLDLSNELRLYGDLDRKSTGRHKDRPGGNVGSRFWVMRDLPEFRA